MINKADFSAVMAPLTQKTLPILKMWHKEGDSICQGEFNEKEERNGRFIEITNTRVLFSRYDRGVKSGPEIKVQDSGVKMEGLYDSQGRWTG